MRRSRVITSWINTLVLTVGVTFGVLAVSHHLTPAATATSAPVSSVSTPTTTPTSARQTALIPLTTTFRGDDQGSHSSDY